MQIYKAPVDDIRFLLELFDYSGKVSSLEAYQDFDLESAMAIIEEAAKFGVRLPMVELVRDNADSTSGLEFPKGQPNDQ